MLDYRLLVEIVEPLQLNYLINLQTGYVISLSLKQQSGFTEKTNNDQSTEPRLQ